MYKLYFLTSVFAIISFYANSQDSTLVQIDSIIQTENDCCDSLFMIMEEYQTLHVKIEKSKNEMQLLKAESLQLNQQILNLTFTNESLAETNHSLNEKTQELQQSLSEKEALLKKQIRAIEEKEKILAEKEAIYKEAMYSKKIDSLELASLIREKDMALQGKKKELSLLEKDIEEKESSIKTTSSELEKLRNKAEESENKLGQLKDENTQLKVENTEKDKDIEQLEQKVTFLEKDLKRTEKDLDNCINKDKRKKVRVVQGIAFKGFRAPQYELAPQDVNNTNVYVINNKNAGSMELDYITGASIKLIDINPEKWNQSSDLSLFVGFGGKDLFKNFYFGPNLMIYNVIHINAGLNFREYEILKSGFDEGDVMPIGTPIPTNNSWKITGYLGLTLDLNVFSSIAKKR